MSKKVFSKKLPQREVQTRHHKYGEIIYREKLVEQQILSKGKYFDDHKQNVDEVMEGWILPQLSDMERIMKSISLKPHSKILELGAEYAHCSSWLINHGYYSVAVDLSFASLSKGTTVVCKQLGFDSLPPRVTGDIEYLPFKNSQFDAVFCFSTLHHFPSFELVLNEVWRVLKRDGIFFFAREPMGSIIGIDILYRRLRNIPLPSEVAYGIHEGSPNYFQWLRPFRQKFRIARVSNGNNPISNSKVSLLALIYGVVTGTSGIEVIARKL